MVQNYQTDEVLDFFLVDDDSDLSGKEFESDSDEKIIENSRLNLDKKDDIHVNTDTIGSVSPR